MELEDPQGGPDESSDPHHADREGTSGDFLGMASVYTSPDGAMYRAGKLHVKLLDENNDEHNIFVIVLIAPAYMNAFNELAHQLANTVFIEAHITPI